MRQIIPLELSEIIPEPFQVLRSQGVRKDTPVWKNILLMVDEALELFSSFSQPVSIMSELSREEFESVFQGEGENEEDTPLEQIFPKAAHLALFALTVGPQVSEKIDDLFTDNDFALGAMLDTVASLAAENGAEVLEQHFQDNLEDKKYSSEDNTVLGYSPGYCGWHVSGQKKLFQCLKPKEIGITLNDSYLMNPLKSVSGILVDGKTDIHFFESNYPFCSTCRTHSCQIRMKNIETE